MMALKFARRGCVLTIATMLAAVGFCRPAAAQGNVLDALYGDGVHAYHAHQYDAAILAFNEAINNGYKDPRAYYFRGLAADALGRAYEAEADWEAGAELEAAGRINADIGRSLARIQGHRRADLETIRRQAQLRALAVRASRSQLRTDELRGVPLPEAQSPQPMPVAPQPAPPGLDDNPFADDLADPQVQSKDALEGAMDENPFSGDVAAPSEPAQPAGDAGGVFDDAPADAGADPFDIEATGEDPFGASGF